ncbi:MAG TPA: hypothetical protein VIT91_03595 [Chthoniobacterales bacterium]
MSDSPAQTTPAPNEIPAAEAAKVAKYVRISKTVAAISFVLTVLTVAVAYMTKGNVLLSMLVVGLNIVAVAVYAMHLNAEQSHIRRAVFFSVLFLLDMFLVTLLAYSDRIHLPH